MVLSISHSLVNTNKFRVIKNEDTGECHEVPLLSPKEGVEISCPCCGQRMNKNGFANYVKTVFSLGSGTEKTEYIPQILRCSNPDCPAKTKSDRNITHVLLFDDHVPKHNITASVLDDAYTAQNLIKEWAEKNGKNTVRLNFLKKLKVENAKNILKEMTDKNLLSHRYLSDYSYFLESFVIGRVGRRLYGYMSKLTDFFPGLLSTYKANLKAEEKHAIQSTDCQQTDDDSPKFSNILRILSSHLVRSVSILPKYSLAHISNTIPTCSETRPNTG